MFPAHHSGFRTIADKAKKIYDAASGAKEAVTSASAPPAKRKFFGETREFVHDVKKGIGWAGKKIGAGIKKAPSTIKKAPGFIPKIEATLAKHPKALGIAGAGLAAYTLLRPRRDE
jgi:hypothetical protein